jgi:hypothetical protein
MADVKISGLPASTVPLAGTEVLPIVQGGATKQVSIANVTAGRAVSALSVTTDTNKAASSAGGALQANNATVCLQWGDGGGSGLIFNGGVSSTAANAALVFSPTGTGTVAISPAGALTVNPTTASTINNTSIGATTALTGRFTSVTATTGSVVIGTSGQGIDFSATPGTGTSELLADYEEGTFTPTWTSATGSGATVNNALGWYTKVGNRVIIDVYLGTNGHGTSAGAITIGGLPFTSTANANQLGGFYCAQIANSGLGIGQMVAGTIAYNTSTFFPIALTAVGGATSIITAAEWGVSGLYRFTGSYQV